LLLMKRFHVTSVIQINRDFVPIDDKSTLLCCMPESKSSNNQGI
jgi:hypothetical protein